jgi:hypothetical protein
MTRRKIVTRIWRALSRREEQRPLNWLDWFLLAVVVAVIVMLFWPG